MDYTQNILDEITNLSKRIKAQQPSAITESEKQAAVTMDTLGKAIRELIMEHMSVKVIFLSLFYFWIILDAPLRGVTKNQLNNWSTPLPEAVTHIINVIKSTVATLPNYTPTADMERLSTCVNTIKSFSSDEHIDSPLPAGELTKQVTVVNTLIHTVTSDLLKQYIHPEIITNVLLSYWIRISTINNNVSEEYYQKIEYYFSEIKRAIIEQVPKLFL
jgi:hypothetical protein